ncbi:hypothetical protein HOLleu_36507 [Holothuria leucospilota]|uniref:arylamine N-acetyltransferase n=1 Tax=Holothuria leucospilota TaxID=206669 RepID=A0A9Q1BFQ6_HOLLE|nr:hypothetical protein HOLleu_36507 [Holothuria leucospilota]
MVPLSKKALGGCNFIPAPLHNTELLAKKPIHLSRILFKDAFACSSFYTFFILFNQVGGQDNAEVSVTKEEAINFVEKVLELHNPIAAVTKNPLEFLQELHKKLRYSVPFTNLSYATKAGLQTVDPKQKKDLLFRQQGGLCFDVFPLIKAVFQHLGYKPFLISAGIPSSRTRVTESHVGLVVKDITYPGSVHLVETGTRHPILQPVALDFSSVSQEYHLGLYPVRFFKDGPGIVKMCSPNNDDNGFSKIKFEGEKWKVLITYRLLQHRSTHDCYNVVNYLAKNNNDLPEVRNQLFIFGFSQGLPTSIVGNQFFQYSKNGLNKKKRTLRNDSEIIKTVQEHFPQYSTEKLEEGLTFWNSVRE